MSVLFTQSQSRRCQAILESKGAISDTLNDYLDEPFRLRHFILITHKYQDVQREFIIQRVAETPLNRTTSDYHANNGRERVSWP